MEAKYHIERARKAYNAFKILREKNLIEDAFSRGYYTLLHLGFAVLLNADETLPKTHTGLIAKLWSLQKKLSIEDTMIKQISRFQAIRESGDYAPLPAVTEKDLHDIDTLIKKFFKILGEKI